MTQSGAAHLSSLFCLLYSIFPVAGTRGKECRLPVLNTLLCNAQVGATVGKGQYRVQAAEALLASMKSSAASSPETKEKILQASVTL